MKITLSVLLTLLAVAVIGVALIHGSGLSNFAADEPHPAPVNGLIEFARERFIAARSEDLEVPDLDDPRMIADGGAHYVPMCSGCHLGPGTEDTGIRLGLYPQPPQLAKAAGHAGGHDHVNMAESAKRQFWIIKHGIKLTAMPAWGTTHDDAEIWALAAFLQKLPEMSAAEYAALGQGEHRHGHEAHGEHPQQPSSPSPDHIDPSGTPPHRHGQASESTPDAQPNRHQH